MSIQNLIEEYDKFGNRNKLSELLDAYSLNSNDPNVSLFIQKLLKLKQDCNVKIDELSNQFANKTVLVTGGSSGIGCSIVDLYLKAGANVIVFDIQKLPNHLAEARYFNVDVRNKFQIQEALANINNLDILIACAGIFAADEDMSEEEKQRMVDVNIYGTKYICELCMPLLQKNKGQICTITSGLSKTIDITCLLYCITKQEIIKLTEQYASQYEVTGVRANSVLPGPILTPLLVNAMQSIKDLIDMLI